MSDNDFGSAIDRFIAEQDQPARPNVHAALTLAAGSNPDFEAELRRLSVKTGVPLETARNMPDEIKRQAAIQDANPSMIETQFPKVARFLADGDNANVAHDDIDTLSKMESTIGAIRGQSPSLKNYVAGVGSAFAQAGERIRQGIRTQFADAYDALGLFSPEATAKMRADAGEKTSRANLYQAASTPEFESSTARGIYGGVTSAAQMVPSLTAAVLMRNPSLVLMGAGVQSEAEAYGKYRSRGASAGQSMLGAAGEAAVEVGTEMIPMGYLVNTFGKVGAGKFLTGLLAREVPSEQVATLAQDALDTAIANPDKTWGEYAAERSDAAYQTLLATVTQSTMFGGAHAAAHKIGHKMEQVQQAQQNADLMTSLGQAATDSKLLARLPEKMREFIQKAKEGGPVSDVLIPAEAFSTYFQTAGIDPAIAAQEAGVKNYAEAMATGSDLSIPLEDYITSIARTEHHNALVQDMRFHPGEMTLRESANFEEHRDEIIQAFMDSTGEVETDSAYNTIYEDMLGQLVGQYDRGTAEQNAIIYAKGMTTMAGRANKDALEMHKKYGMRIINMLPEVLKKGTADIGIDPLLERLRAGDVPTDDQIFGERLAEFVRKNGGLTDEGGDLRAMDADKGNRPFQKNLIQLTGRHPDAMRQLAAEEGFLSDDTTTADFLDLLDQDLNGGGAYRQHGANQELLGLREMLGHIDDFLRNSGLDLNSMTNEQVRAAMDAAAAQPADESTQYDQGTEGRAAERRTRTIEVDGVRRPITNSRGQLVAKDFAGQLAFWKWFGDSQAVDEQGQPLVLYHGTNADISVFDPKRLASNSGNDGHYGAGFYFSTDPREAQTYGDAVMPVYLRMENPITNTVDSLRSIAPKFGFDPEVVDVDREWFLNQVRKLDDNGAMLAEMMLDPSWSDGDGWDKFEQRGGVIVGGKLDLNMVMDAVDALKDGRIDGLRLDIVQELTGEIPDSALVRDYSQFSQPNIRYMTDNGAHGVQFSEAARALGHDGVIAGSEFVAFDPEQIKSATGNSGAFDAGNPNILFQGAENDNETDSTTGNLAQSVNGASPAGTQDVKRGFIQFGADRKFSITLLEKADLSTFTHELGHFWLEVLGDLASEENAPPEIAADYKTLLDWFKVENRDGIQTEHHEQFARGWEAYLMEGKAPSAELRGVFQRFKAWMTLIYKKLSGLNVKLNDDVRAVFDRIIASDDEIKNAAAEMGQVQIFATAAEAGMTDAEFAAYSKTVQAASTAARETLEQKLMREYSRAQKAWYKDERAKVKAEVDAEVSQLPIYLAFDVLTGGKAPDGSAIKLNKADLVERYGAEFLKKLPRSKHHVYSVEGGYAVDLAAEVLGFDSADSLVESLVNMRPKKALIEAETDARMVEKHGDMRFDGTIADEAMSAVHNEERATVLAAELRALRRKAREVRQVTNALDREDARQRNAMMDSVPPLAAIRSIAAGQIGQKQVRDLTPGLYLTAEKKAARQAFELAAKGQYQEAAAAKQKELLNHYLYREAVKAQEEIEKIREYANKLAGTGKQGSLGKAGGDYQEQINELLERYEFKKVSGTQLDRRASLRSWYDEQIAAGFEPAIPADLLDSARQVNYKEVPVDELRAVRDALRSIERLAQLKNRLLMKGEKVEREAAIAEMVDAAEKNVALQGKATPFDSQKSALSRVGDVAAGFGAEMLRVEGMMDLLDGGRADGPWHRYIFNRASESQTEFLDLMGEVGARVQALVEEHAKHGKMDDKFKTPLSNDAISRYELISLALNVGNVENHDKLVRGMAERFGAQWTAGNVETAISRLNAADLTFIQAVWDEVNTMWPKIAELQKRISGVEPGKVEGRSYQIRDSAGNITHELKGGYFPLVYDPLHSAAGEKQETGPLAGLTEAGYAPATTPRGHTKARTDFAAPLLLDFGHVLQKHLTGVARDLTHREFLIDANRLFNDKRIKTVLQERLGPAYQAAMMPWLKSIANDGVTGEPVGPFGKIFEWSRSAVTTVVLGFKVSTIAVQATGLLPSMEYVGAEWMAEGLKQTAAAGPLYAFKGELLDTLMAKSGELRHRFDNMDREMRDLRRQMKAGKGTKAANAVREASMIGIAYADRMVVIPTWIGQYEKALSQGMSEQNAIHSADGAVRMSQGSGAPKDLSQLQRRGGATKLFTMFMTPFGAQFARLYNAKRELDQNGMKYAPQAIVRVLMLTVIPAVLADLITSRGPEECSIMDGADGVACYAKWAAIKGTFSLGASVPLLRDASNRAEDYLMGRTGGDLRVSPVLDTYNKVSKSAIQSLEVAFGEREFDEKMFWDMMEISGYVTKLPTAQPRITLEYLRDLQSGKAQPDNAGELLHNLAFRRKEKDK